MGTLKVGQYELSKLLGEGGMGSVYEAHHIESKERVAIKIINADVASHSTVLARFEIEARAASAIQSPYVAKVLDFGREDGAPFLVMELYEGKDLETLFGERKILPPELMVRLATQCCLGLQKAHERGIVHRDIKPANLILAETPSSGDLVLKVLDFGIAKVHADEWQSLSEEPLTRTGSLLGSPRYMSPEQARGYKNIDQRTDLFSLATVMYQGLAGHTPHHRVEAMGDLIVTLCSDAAPPLRSVAPWIDPRLERIVARALNISVTERYQSAAAMAKDLLELYPESASISRSLLRTFEPPANVVGGTIALPVSLPKHDVNPVSETLPNPAALPKLEPHPIKGAEPAPSPVISTLLSEASNEPARATTHGATAAPRPEQRGSAASIADLDDGESAIPLPWVAAGILLSLVIGIGSVGAGVIPLPSRSSSNSASAASISAAPISPIAEARPTLTLPSASAASPASSAPPPQVSAKPESSGAPSAKPALTGKLSSLSVPKGAPSPSPISSSVTPAPPPVTPTTPPALPTDSPL